MSEPTVTVTLPQETHKRLLADVIDAQTKAEALRQELVVERAKTTEQRLTEVMDLLEAFKTIADHATANLHPEFIRDLPAEAFETAAKHIAQVMGATQRDKERAEVWSERSKLIQDWRDRRKARIDDGSPAGAPLPTKRWWWPW